MFSFHLCCGVCIQLCILLQISLLLHTLEHACSGFLFHMTSHLTTVYCCPFADHTRHTCIAQEWLAESPVMNVTYTQYSQPTPFLPLFPTTVRQHPWELKLLPSMQWWMLYISIWFYTMITMTSLQPTQVQGLGYKYVTSVPLSIKIYDSVVNVHGLVLASSPGQFPRTTWLRNEANMI